MLLYKEIFEFLFCKGMTNLKQISKPYLYFYQIIFGLND